MTQHQTPRPLPQLLEWSRLVVSHKRIRELTDAGTSPNSVAETVEKWYKNKEIARAARWLAMIHRDYPTYYQEVILKIQVVDTDSYRKSEN